MNDHIKITRCRRCERMMSEAALCLHIVEPVRGESPHRYPVGDYGFCIDCLMDVFGMFMGVPEPYIRNDANREEAPNG